MFHVEQWDEMNREEGHVIVVGGGHAGIEAALAAARMGCQVTLLTMDSHAIGRMSCNPAIGGTAKGHLVREIDALGGEMGKIADATGIHFRLLNKSKGPAVWSPRSQNDREWYSREARRRILEQHGLSVVEGSLRDILIERKYCHRGVLTDGSCPPLFCACYLQRDIPERCHAHRNVVRTGREVWRARLNRNNRAPG